LNIRKKLSWSILLLTTLLVLAAGTSSAVQLKSTQTEALWGKGRSLSTVLVQAVTASFHSDDGSATVGAAERALDYFGEDPDVSQAAVVTVDVATVPSAPEERWTRSPWRVPWLAVHSSMKRTASWWWPRP
jgi:uncharacterized membrane protein